MTVTVQVRYFAALREALGDGEAVTLEVTDAAQAPTVGDLRAHLMRCSPVHAEALDRGRLLRCALDQTLCAEAAPLRDGAEVAFFPPVTGG
jgi:molybdopterin synthase sulfur carrier subunit